MFFLLDDHFYQRETRIGALPLAENLAITSGEVRHAGGNREKIKINVSSYWVRLTKGGGRSRLRKITQLAPGAAVHGTRWLSLKAPWAQLDAKAVF